MAIKMLARESDEQSKVKFLQEAAIMSQFKHPNVIKLYGVVNDDDGVCVCLNKKIILQLLTCFMMSHNLSVTVLAYILHLYISDDVNC